MQRDFILPDTWNDDDEMFSLMQRIKRPRNIDPLNYDKKILFWSSLITDYAKQNKIVVISETALKKVFSRNFVADGIILEPECLPQILNHMLDSGDICDNISCGYLSFFMKIGYEFVVKKPIEFAWSFFKEENFNEPNFDNRNYESPDKLLYLPKIADELIKQLISSLYEKNNSLVPGIKVYLMEDFSKAIYNFFSHEPSRIYIKNYLLKCGLITVVRTSLKSNPTLEIVYINDPSDAAEQPRLDIEVVSALAHLRKSSQQMLLDEKRMTKEAITCRIHAKLMLNTGRKTEALQHLRRAKLLDVELSRKSQQIANLESLEMQITAAKDTQSVLKVVMEAGKSLKHITGGAEGVTTAEDTMVEASEAVEDFNKISSILGSGSFGEFDSDLEDELSELLSKDEFPSPPVVVKTRDPQKKPSAGLPSQPTVEPQHLSDAEIDRQLSKLADLRFEDLPEIQKSHQKISTQQ